MMDYFGGRTCQKMHTDTGILGLIQARPRKMHRPPTSSSELGALTDVLRKMGIFSDEDKLRTVSQPVGREVTVLRGLRRDEANDLLKLLRVAPDGRETALASQS